MAGITTDTPDPEFGVIDRDPKTGEPTGYLSETAMRLIGLLVGRPDEDAWYRSISRSLDQIRAYGTTSIVDMAVGPEILAAYRRLEEEGNLNFRVAATIALNDYQAEFTTAEESEAVLAKRDELETPLIKIGLKYWADGAPLSKTALLVEPYSDDPSTYGEMTIGEKELERIVQAHKDGIQVRMHATGDGTTRKLLDTIEKARTEDPKQDRSRQ
jgi:predicted amidohydrolase YtcJ